MSLQNTFFIIARLTINVLDVNDNAPRFRPFGVSNFTEKILEGAQPGTTLLSVSAVDPDKGPNGQVIYQLLHLPRGGYVRLEDPSTGMTTGRQLNTMYCITPFICLSLTPIPLCPIHSDWLHFLFHQRVTCIFFSQTF